LTFLKRFVSLRLGGWFLFCTTNPEDAKTRRTTSGSVMEQSVPVLKAFAF